MQRTTVYSDQQKIIRHKSWADNKGNKVATNIKKAKMLAENFKMSKRINVSYSSHDIFKDLPSKAIGLF